MSAAGEPGERASAPPESSSAPPESFGATYRVRFDEAGPDGWLRPSGFLRYAQDVAWQHSEARGLDRAWYAERGLAWVVRAVELTILAPAPMGRPVDVQTAVVGHRRIWARRRVRVSAADVDLAIVDTDWVLLDGRGRPVRIAPIFEATFAVPPIEAPMLRVTLPAPPAAVSIAEIEVRPSELDPMGHVNNAVYLDWLDDARRAAGATSAGATAAGATAAGTAVAGTTAGARIRIEYAASATAGQRVAIETWTTPDGSFQRLTADGRELVRAVTTTIESDQS